MIIKPVKIVVKSLLSFLALNFLLSSCQSAEELKSEQYFVEGHQLYTTYCANCHQDSGEGMANLYPPLKGSSALTDRALLACIIKNGMKDTILVAGKKFSRPMPGNPKLSDLEIAEIVTFLTMKWHTDSTYTPIEEVSRALQNCKVN